MSKDSETEVCFAKFVFRGEIREEFLDPGSRFNRGFLG
jgi:hypothetical protein